MNTTGPGQHTPWEVKGIGHNVYVETVDMDPDGGFVCDMQADATDTPEERARIDAKAAFIVLACNSHDDLLAACKAIDSLMEMLWDAVDWGKTFNLDIATLNLVPMECKNAIAKAEGKPSR